MLKRILLPLDPSPYTDCATAFAISLAKIYGAEITGLVVLDIPGIKASTGPLPPGVGFYAKGLEHSKIERAQVHIQNLLSKFKSKCEEAGVKHRESNAQGSPSERISEFSKFYDIVITGIKNKFQFETSEELENTLDSFLDKSVTPIIAVPEEFSNFHSSSNVFKVMIAYNGSLPATRALQNFAKLNFPKEIEATVFISDEDTEQAEAMFENVREYLTAHNITHIHKLVTTEDKISVFTNKLLDEYDIVVLGAHSKIGIFDFLVGSLARHLINENKTMLFLSE
ncbi:MAG: universal stress protein [bacterium]